MNDAQPEKQRIERATAEAFLALYNQAQRTDYQIVAQGDAPDVRCRNSDGAPLQLEITLTEDRTGDIAALLGRAQRRRRIAPTGSALAGNVLDQVARRIHKKLGKDYGPDTALVVRDTSGVDWDWELVVDDLRARIAQIPSPFQKGVWILNVSQTKLFCILEPPAAGGALR